MTITIWLHKDQKTFSFWPPEHFLAKWIIILPKGAEIISCPSRGILVQESEGDLLTPECIMSCAKVKYVDYDIIDGYDPDHWLGRIDI